MIKKQFIYFLKLATTDFTEKDEKIIKDHFNRLLKLKEKGKVILAGRTQDENPIGIVILEVDSLKEAQEIVENDPAVKFDIMKAELRPYKIAI